MAGASEQSRDASADAGSDLHGGECDLSDDDLTAFREELLEGLRRFTTGEPIDNYFDEGV